MKRTRKWAGFFFLLAAILLTACGEKQDLPPEPEDGVLTYAALNPVTEELSESIERFNRTHEDVQIEVRDYSDKNGIDRLFTELALGQVPDMMEMHRFGRSKDAAPADLPYRGRPAGEYWMPYRQMAEKGYLEDLWPYIENDPALGTDNVLMPPLKASEVDGGLYMVFPQVSITTMLEGMQIIWPRAIGYSDAIWQERASFVGYPTADGSSGSFFYATGHKLGMSSTCKDKDAAWEFMRDLIRPRLRRGKPLAPLSDIPVNLSDYEMMVWGELREAGKLTSQFPENPLRYFPGTRHFEYGPEIPLMHLVTEEDTQRFKDLVDHTTQLYWPNDELSNIVWESLGAYFAGDRTLDDTVRLIDNRVSLYLNEQK